MRTETDQARPAIPYCLLATDRAHSPRCAVNTAWGMAELRRLGYYPGKMSTAATPADHATNRMGPIKLPSKIKLPNKKPIT